MKVKTGPFLLLCLFFCVSAAQAQMGFRTYVSVAGNDANTSTGCQQSAPCRNFNAALSVTPTHGEVVAMDTGEYASFTITQSVTIQAASGADVNIAPGVSDVITVNAGPNDYIVIRGLNVNGFNFMAPSGIHFFSGGTLQVENCILSDFFFAGLILDGAGKLVVTDTVVRNSSYGVILQTTSGQIHASLDRVQLKNNFQSGLDVRNNAQAIVSNSVIAENFFAGAEASGPDSAPAALLIEDSTITGNNTGVSAMASSIVRLSRSTISDNTQGVAPFGGQILSFGNNRVFGNGTDGFFTGMIALQ